MSDIPENPPPREYTLDETRDILLEHFRELVKYWENARLAPTVREKLDGLMYCALVVLDGAAPPIPGFILSPDPHPDDKEYAESRGENWFPSGGNLGSLHEFWYQRNGEKE